MGLFTAPSGVMQVIVFTYTSLMVIRGMEARMLSRSLRWLANFITPVFPAAKAPIDVVHAVQVANLQSVVVGPQIDFFRIGLAKRVVGALDGSTFTVA